MKAVKWIVHVHCDMAENTDTESTDSENYTADFNIFDVLTDGFEAIAGIKGAKFSPEDTRQAKPAIVVLNPEDDVTEDELQNIGLQAKKVAERALGYDVKASIEYPIYYDEQEDDLLDVDDEQLIKLRWMVQSYGSLKDTRLNGYPITEEEESAPEYLSQVD